MYHPRNNPTVSFFTYVMFTIFHADGGFDIKQEAFKAYVKDQNMDLDHVLAEIESTGLVDNDDGLLMLREPLFLAQILDGEETLEYVVGGFMDLQAFDYTADKLLALNEAGIEAQAKIEINTDENAEISEEGEDED